MTDGYTTDAQAIYWGDSSSGVALSAVVTGAPIAGEAQMTRRNVLASTYPRLAATRADYRVTIPQLLIDSESEAMRAKPEAVIAVIQTDAETALVMAAMVAGIPRQAEQNGEIISNLTVQPRGAPVRAKATELDGKNVTVGTADKVYAVVASGTGAITRGSKTITAANKVVIAELDDPATTVSVAAGVKGYLLSGPAVSV